MTSEAVRYGLDRRIEFLIPLIGAAGSFIAFIGWGWRAAAGTAVGAAVCWLNFRWLRQGAAGVIKLGLAQAGAEHARVPRKTHAKFLGRLGLLLLAVYAILVWLRLPAVPVLCGLTAVFPAVIFGAGYEALRGHNL
ncbi:MAG TPA: ATP synthase subunit I [Candidatus Acidoferrales bacterium]|nr:ATP synthase subunit I [Candidatus Acidoferrales bacterium]